MAFISLLLWELLVLKMLVRNIKPMNWTLCVKKFPLLAFYEASDQYTEHCSRWACDRTTPSSLGSSESQVSRKIWTTQKVWITQCKPCFWRSKSRSLVGICSCTNRSPVHTLELWRAMRSISFSKFPDPLRIIFLRGTDCERLRLVVAWISLRIPFLFIIPISIYGAFNKCQMLWYTLHIY